MPGVAPGVPAVGVPPGGQDDGVVDPFVWALLSEASCGTTTAPAIAMPAPPSSARREILLSANESARDTNEASFGMIDGPRHHRVHR
jgi:hypothetical protein